MSNYLCLKKYLVDQFILFCILDEGSKQKQNLHKQITKFPPMSTKRWSNNSAWPRIVSTCNRKHKGRKSTFEIEYFVLKEFSLYEVLIFYPSLERFWSQLKNCAEICTIHLFCKISCQQTDNRIFKSYNIFDFGFFRCPVPILDAFLNFGNSENNFFSVEKCCQYQMKSIIPSLSLWLHYLKLIF